MRIQPANRVVNMNFNMGGDVGVSKRTVAGATSVAMIAALACTFALLFQPSLDPHHPIGDGFPSSTDVRFQDEADVARVLLESEQYLRQHGRWAFQPLNSVQEATSYLTSHSRMSKHVQSFVDAAFQGIPNPSEDLGYSYIACAAGGPLIFDGFDASPVNVSLSVSPDLTQLTRRFLHRSIMHSTLNTDVIQRCGESIHMEGTPTDAGALELPYASSFDVTITVKEIWKSNVRVAAGSAQAGGKVSIRPFNQWTLHAVTAHAKLTSTRDYSSWVDRYGGAALIDVFGQSRWAALQQATQRSQERVIGEVEMTCDMTNPVTAARCLHPHTLFTDGSGTNGTAIRLLHSGIFLQWQEIKWLAEETE